MDSPCAKRRRMNNANHAVHSEINHLEMPWTDDRKVFYNSWGFDMEDVEEMPAQWSELSYSKRRTKCTMCGGDDHLMSSCPEACCLKCGEKTDYFEDQCANCVTEASTTCEICGYRGHSKYNCPYVWKYLPSTIPALSSPMCSMHDNPQLQLNWNGNENSDIFY
ncbi:protein air1-like [Bradysia coprophila]|uniref:protein air1-like n=1 Tax=Bradysia coprophila TaxID=38358 RepID=UPI00187D7331|nr:protein air1-like [Bradysia coprophila]